MKRIFQNVFRKLVKPYCPGTYDFVFKEREGKSPFYDYTYEMVYHPTKLMEYLGEESSIVATYHGWGIIWFDVQTGKSPRFEICSKLSDKVKVYEYQLRNLSRYFLEDREKVE